MKQVTESQRIFGSSRAGLGRQVGELGKTIGFCPIQVKPLMSDEDLIQRREAAFEEFYNSVMGGLVDFVGYVGIQPAHEVLNHAPRYLSSFDAAISALAIESEEDKSLLTTVVGSYVGEYFSQKYGGCWQVAKRPASKYFGRYVISSFGRIPQSAAELDPFSVAQSYVSQPLPRDLSTLLTEVENELLSIKV